MINNIAPAVVYFAVRWSEDATWLNDRDQFLYPCADPLQDTDFVNDSLVFSIFHGNNHISIQKGENHWIPYSEQDLGVTAAPFTHATIYKYLKDRDIPDSLSLEARVVYDIGLEIFRYYHTGNRGKPFSVSQDGKFRYNHNAALYDIRQFFQGTKDNGHMRVKSGDVVYQELIERLRVALKVLRDNRISPKVYEYGFLLQVDV